MKADQEQINNLRRVFNPGINQCRYNIEEVNGQHLVSLFDDNDFYVASDGSDNEVRVDIDLVFCSKRGVLFRRVARLSGNVVLFENIQLEGVDLALALDDSLFRCFNAILEAIDRLEQEISSVNNDD